MPIYKRITNIIAENPIPSQNRICVIKKRNIDHNHWVSDRRNVFINLRTHTPTYQQPICNNSAFKQRMIVSTIYP